MMRVLRFFLAGGMFYSAQAWAGLHLDDLSTESFVGHLDLEASSLELRRKLEAQVRTDQDGVQISEPSIEEALRIGKRLLDWIEAINAEREPGSKIRLTSPETRRGIPITAPNRYSPLTVARDFAIARDGMPQGMREVLFHAKSLPAQNPISDEDFIKSGRLIDRVYQTAARWTLLSPYKFQYARNIVRDVRGYYYLNTNNWNSQTLANWSNLDSDVQTQIKDALRGICVNARVSASSCARAVSEIRNANDAIAMYVEYIDSGKSIYDAFFVIRNPRRDIHWNSKTAVMATVPFFDPVREDVRRFIKENIEDEFQWMGWGLKVNFVERKPAPYIVFIPGVTANVEFLGGNKIEMDANKSLDEYEERWTIRHEFGHVLGIPDCYHEFYDQNADEFVNYQIDISDLMCSRAGDMTERIFDQLKSEYMR